VSNRSDFPGGRRVQDVCPYFAGFHSLAPWFGSHDVRVGIAQLRVLIPGSCWCRSGRGGGTEQRTFHQTPERNPSCDGIYRVRASGPEDRIPQRSGCRQRIRTAKNEMSSTCVNTTGREREASTLQARNVVDMRFQR
jgi:hypothetical protein